MPLGQTQAFDTTKFVAVSLVKGGATTYYSAPIWVEVGSGGLVIDFGEVNSDHAVAGIYGGEPFAIPRGDSRL